MKRRGSHVGISDSEKASPIEIICDEILAIEKFEFLANTRRKFNYPMNENFGV